MATTARTRPLPRQEGLRPADPERVGLRLDHRHAGRAEQGRPVDRRHRRRHVRLHRTSWPRCCSARSTAAAGTSTSRCSKRWASGWATRCTTPSTAPRRRRAPARRHATIYPYGPVPDRRRQDRDARPAERARVGAASATRCCSSRRWRRTRASPATPSAWPSRDALRALIVETFAALTRRAGGRSASKTRRSPTPQRATTWPSLWQHPQLARARPLARGRHAGRPGAGAAAARLLGRRRPAPGRGAGARPAHRRDPGRTGPRRRGASRALRAAKAI